MDPVDYLIIKLIWYVVAAFLIGGFVGWFSCGRTSE
jgi:hypothetical protein